MSIDWFPMGGDGRAAPVGFVTYAPALKDDESGHRWRETVCTVEQERIGAVLIPRHPWLPRPNYQERPSMHIRRALCIREIEELGAPVIEIGCQEI